MNIEDLGILRQPFHTRGQPVTFVRYKAQQEAFDFLQQVMTDIRGLVLLHGPEASGKTTIINQFVQGLPSKRPVAVVDATRMGASELLATLLSQFGYEGSIDLASGRSNLLTEVSGRVISENQVPLIILENIDIMYPSGLRALRELAALTVQQKFALRFILVSHRDCSDLICSSKLSPMATRLVGSFELGVLTAKETAKYLHAKLQESGVSHPHRVLPIATCVELHKESSGRPGTLDALTLRAISWVDRLPIRREHIYPLTAERPRVRVADSVAEVHEDDADTPKLLISVAGNLVQEFNLTQSTTVFGRARLNDVVMNNEFVSKYHAIIFYRNDTFFLVDLNSSNGMFVNSRRMRSAVLRNDDIIEIGNHRMKLHHPATRTGAKGLMRDLADTSVMKTVADMRRMVAKKLLREVPEENRKSSPKG